MDGDIPRVELRMHLKGSPLDKGRTQGKAQWTKEEKDQERGIKAQHSDQGSRVLGCKKT